MEWVNAFSSPEMDIPGLNQAAFGESGYSAGDSWFVVFVYPESKSSGVFEAGDFNWTGYRSLCFDWCFSLFVGLHMCHDSYAGCLGWVP